MHLKSVKLSGFRGYHTTTVIPIDEAMTGSVGRNDDGQSAMLSALAVVFARGNATADKSDSNGLSLRAGIWRNLLVLLPVPQYSN